MFCWDREIIRSSGCDAKNWLSPNHLVASCILELQLAQKPLKICVVKPNNYGVPSFWFGFSHHRYVKEKRTFDGPIPSRFVFYLNWKGIDFSDGSDEFCSIIRMKPVMLATGSWSKLLIVLFGICNNVLSHNFSTKKTFYVRNYTHTTFLNLQ